MKFMCIAFVLCLHILLVSCSKTSNNEAITHEASTPTVIKEKKLLLSYSERIEHPVGIGPANLDGSTSLQLAKYAGARHKISVTVKNVRFQTSGPSIGIEGSTVYFAVKAGQKLPSAIEDTRKIEMTFDKYAYIEGKAFNPGDSWELILTDEGKLIGLNY